MILCVTPNPAIDRTLLIETLAAGTVLRAEQVLAVAGGKGVNVARTIRLLGGQALCMGMVGGYSGRLLASLAEQEGLISLWTWTRYETRTCVILSPSDGESTLINEPGNTIDIEEVKMFVRDVLSQAEKTRVICVSGSLPRGFGLDDFELLLCELVAQGKQVWVDTSGDALKTALRVKGINIKVNADELYEILGKKLEHSEFVLDSAGKLLRRGVKQIVITMGKTGAAWLDAENKWFVHAPQIQAVSAIGSGDAFLGALVLALETGLSPANALREAVAAGAANALKVGGGMFSLQDFEELLHGTSEA